MYFHEAFCDAPLLLQPFVVFLLLRCSGLTTDAYLRGIFPALAKSGTAASTIGGWWA